MNNCVAALKRLALAAALLFCAAACGWAQYSLGWSDIWYDEGTDEVVFWAYTEGDYGTYYYYEPCGAMDIYMNGAWVTSGGFVSYGEPWAWGEYVFPAQAGVSYSMVGHHQLDAYFCWWEIDPYFCPYGCYDWYDAYGYSFLPGVQPPYVSYLMRVPPMICTTFILTTVWLATTQTSVAWQPALNCNPSSVTRGSNVTCSVSGPGTAATKVSGWSFSGGGATVNGPSGATSWGGITVQGGTVTATIQGYSQSLQASITVNNRSWSSQLPSSTRVYEGQYVGQRCPAFVFAPLPMEGDLLGYSCADLYSATVTASEPISGGPNNGLLYVTDVNFTELYYKWKIHPLLEDTNSDFYKAQCGQGGFTLNTTLVANALRHEGGPSPSHYNSFADGWNDPSLNPPRVAEAKVGQGMTKTAFETSVRNLIYGNWDVIRLQRMPVEPCGDNKINFNSSCVYNGPVNMYKFRNGQYELDPCP